MNYNTPHFKLGLITAAVAALAACGGGDESVTSTVMDGLISNALVCVDTNSNGVCDVGETQGRTNATGKVTLNVTPAEMGSAHLVAMVGTDAVDADTGPVAKAYTLQTPAGRFGVISPLTTMVQAKMDASAVGFDAAEAHVKAQTGLTISVFDDFIAKRGTSAEHKKAGVMARLMVVSVEKSMEASEPACDSTDSTRDKETQVRKNLLARLGDIRGFADQVELSCTTENIAVGLCAGTIQSMAPTVLTLRSPAQPSSSPAPAPAQLQLQLQLQPSSSSSSSPAQLQLQPSSSSSPAPAPAPAPSSSSSSSSSPAPAPALASANYHLCPAYHGTGCWNDRDTGRNFQLEPRGHSHIDHKLNLHHQRQHPDAAGDWYLFDDPPRLVNGTCAAAAA
ncbi:MAG: hypothetical protein IPF71_15555 [Rhodoferax sp.]|nr:hypothetical protein [Rhodoferax sp.]